MSILGKMFGDANARYIKTLGSRVQEINAFGPEFEKFSPDDLRAMTQKFRDRIRAGETSDDLLPEAFAAVREAARRTLCQRHFDVQLVGGMVLHQGKIAEMRTGEGKTLVATLPLYLNALSGKGAHLVTPNDYLSRLGAGWMGPVYHALGVTTGIVAHDFSGIYDPEYVDATEHGDPRLSHFRSSTRREAYAADITYGTNNEFGFDYLRDNLEYAPQEMRQREHHFAIVDEVDSILIDEARTPLIISMPDEESADLYKTFAGIIPRLQENSDYNIDEKMKAVTITEQGIDTMEKILNVGNMYEEKGLRFVRHLEQALRAHALFLRDRDYVVKDGQVIIVDEFTGRLMPGRRWSEGLHQALEAKEGVRVEQESRTLATITFQNYFRMYEKLAGMTGTAETSAEEFHKVYKLDVVTIPTHRPMIRDDRPDLIFRTEKGKFEAVVREVKARRERGEPVLIGTVSIQKNERLSRMLEIEGVPHEVLNAKNHEREALIIAEAGRAGAVTVATNMAGRGVDIILGGSHLETGFPSGSPVSVMQGNHDEVASLGGLFVIGTERHEARRIDNQLRGRAGRQGDPGASQFFVSLEDDLMRVFGSDKIKRLMETLGIPEDQPIENKIVSRALEAAQAKIEGFHFDTRKHVLEYDDVLNKQRDAIYRMRKEILFSESRIKNQESSTEKECTTLKERVFEMLEEEVMKIVAFHTAGSESEWNIEEIVEVIKSIAPIPNDTREKLEEIRGSAESTDPQQEAIKNYLVQTLKTLYESREKSIGEEQTRTIERSVMLRSIDMLWMDHLDQMEHLRDSVRLRAYGQRDPLVEYKHEGSRLFRELQAAIQSQIVNNIFKVGIMSEAEKPRRVQEKRPELSAPILNVTMNNTASDNQGTPRQKSQPAISRNDPCPCGSGKKYKRCHGV